MSDVKRHREQCNWRTKTSGAFDFNVSASISVSRNRNVCEKMSRYKKLRNEISLRSLLSLYSFFTLSFSVSNCIFHLSIYLFLCFLHSLFNLSIYLFLCFLLIPYSFFTLSLPFHDYLCFLIFPTLSLTLSILPLISSPPSLFLLTLYISLSLGKYVCFLLFFAISLSLSLL